MTRLEEFTPAKLAGIPCMRTSILYGVAGGVGVAALRLITGKRKGASRLSGQVERMWRVRV